MTELKTLRDFGLESSGKRYYSDEMLKKEAIKRLKEAQMTGNAINNTTWAIFFNIKEEDLK